MADQPKYSLPTPMLEEHHYLHAIVQELKAIRVAIQAQAQPTMEVELKEPKPVRGQKEPLSMVEPVPQEDPVSLVEVPPSEAETKPKVPKRN